MVAKRRLRRVGREDIVGVGGGRRGDFVPAAVSIVVGSGDVVAKPKCCVISFGSVVCLSVSGTRLVEKSRKLGCWLWGHLSCMLGIPCPPPPFLCLRGVVKA